MSSQEVRDWQRFAAVHPFPADLIDLHGAMTACVIANVNRDPKSRPQPYAISDFLILGREATPPPPSQQSEADRMTAVFGG